MKLPLLLPFIGWFFLSIPFSLATNYYVSNSGNNAQSGLSLGDAFETLQHAADQVMAGDTVFVADGSYVGFDLRSASGTANAPIVFQTLGTQVLITQQGPIRDDGINIEGVDYIVLDGFVVNDMAGNGIRLVLADHCVVRHCRCDRNGKRGIFTGFTDDIVIEYNVCTRSVTEHGIYVSNSSDRPIIRFNECYENNNIGIHMNGDLSAGGDGIISDAQVYGNILHDNHRAAGINMDGVENPLIYNNLIYNNHSAQGIALFQQDGAIPTRGAKVYHNTILVPTDGRWGILVKDGSNVGTEIYNNIVLNAHAWRGCIVVEDTAQFRSDYNLLDDKMSDAGDGSAISLAAWQQLGFDGHSLLAMTLSSIFEDVITDDYRLKMGAQAIDVGTSMIGVVMDDLAGNPRPSGSGYDLGCYEYQMASGLADALPISFHIYPNPATDRLYFDRVKADFHVSRVELIEMTGKVAYTFHGPHEAISLQEVARGFYGIRIWDQRGRYVVGKVWVK